MTERPFALDTPIGTLIGRCSDRGLKSLRFANSAAPTESAPAPIAERWRRYVDGDTSALAGIELDLEGTDFQRAVWQEVARIPAGQTASYGDIARAMGRPSAVRAVGAANGANPVALFIPCHRVIGSSGELTGYAWGLWRKRWLLGHEGALAVAETPAPPLVQGRLL